MAWMKGDYSSLFPGASGGNTDPDGHYLYQGGRYPTWRQYYKPHEVDGADWIAAHHMNTKVRNLGRAASLLSHIEGVFSNDRSHSHALDGHQDSVISNHPDGLFGLNSAATTDYSLGANSAHFRGPYPGGGLRPVRLPNYTVDLEGDIYIGTQGSGQQVTTRALGVYQDKTEGILYPKDPFETPSQHFEPLPKDHL